MKVLSNLKVINVWILNCYFFYRRQSECAILSAAYGLYLFFYQTNFYYVNTN